MSYDKAMRHSIRKSKKQGNNYFGCSALESNERRRLPWLGAAWFEDGMDAEREMFIQKWKDETERMLIVNPKLVIVG